MHRRSGGSRCRADVEILHHRPQEADELTRDRDDGNLRLFPISEMLIARMESLLRLPRMRDDGRRLSALPPLDLGAQVWPIVIGPRRLHEHVSAVTVAGLGDRALPLAWTARVFACHEPQVRRELPWALK